MKDPLPYGCGCLTLALGISLGGCAFSFDPFVRDIVEAPLYRDSTISMPSAEPSSGYSGGANRSVVVPAFINKRPNKSRIGMKKNHSDGHTANVLAAENINEWLGLRFGNELKAAGFRVEPNDESTRATKIQGFTQKVFIEPVAQWHTVDFETDLSVLIQISRPDGLVAERRYFVKGRYPYSPRFMTLDTYAMEPTYALSLSQAVDMLMKRVVADVINLLNRFPETELQP